jgi:hypothetical protein
MNRLSFAAALAVGALVALSACTDDSPEATSTMETPTLSQERGGDAGGSVKGAEAVADPKVISLYDNPVSGEQVEVFNGGFGSAIAIHPKFKNVLYLLTDRGPNVDFNGGIAFAVPDFHPQIGVFRRIGHRLEQEQVILLRDQSCNPLTGLPIPPGSTGSTGELAFALDGASLQPDPNGIDSEGLVALADGSFWVSDEYGPFLAHFNGNGCTIERIGPGTGGRALPLVLATRRLNRGMEGLTALDGGRVLVGMMQSPLDNPMAAGRASRLARLLFFDTETGLSRQYAYLLESASLANSEILALSPTRFIVLERDGLFPGAVHKAVKKLYLIDITDATDISDPANGAKGLLVDGLTLEELTANATDPAAVLRAADIEPVAKTLAVDIVAALPGYPHDKVEGIALLGPKTIAVSNDDDFAVAPGAGAMIQKVLPGFTPPKPDFNGVVFVKLP